MPAVYPVQSERAPETGVNLPFGISWAVLRRRSDPGTDSVEIRRAAMESMPRVGYDRAMVRRGSAASMDKGRPGQNRPSSDQHMADRKRTSSEEPTPEIRRHVFIVIPTYNECESIEQVVREVRTEFPQVVVVDDGSQDDSFEAAVRCAPYVLRHAINRGQGAALQTGLEFALARGAEIIVTFDADGQHSVSDIAEMIAPIQSGLCDITLGSRFLGNACDMPRSRRLLLRLAVLFTRITGRLKVTDAHNGFRAFSRRAAEAIDIKLDRMAHASEMIDQIRESKLPFQEIPVHIRYTEYSLRKGQSSRGAFRIVVHYLLGKVLQ